MSAVPSQSTASLAEGGAFLFEENGSRPVFGCEDFTEEQRMFFKTADDFAATEIGPRAQEIDDRGLDLMPELLKKAADLGLCMVEIPEAYGGLGRDITTSMLVTEAMSRVGSWSTTWGGHTGIGTLPIVFFGTEEQKKKYLPRLATTEIIAAYALSEAGSGSDALGARTKAVLSKDGKHWVLNGGKMWITNSRWAGTFIVFAKVDGEKFTAFIVERNTPGFHILKEEPKIGLHGSSTCALSFEDAMVPVENVLGEVGKGHRIAFNVLNHGRIKLGIGALGGCRHMLEAAVRYAKDRKQFNTPIIEFGLIRRKVADMAAKTYALQSMGYRTAGLIDARIARLDADAPDYDAQVIKAIEEYTIEQSIVKVFGTETLDFVVDEALQTLGGYGFVADYPIERQYRDSRINRIFEGTNEINRLLIPATMMKRVMTQGLPVLEFMQEVEADLVAGNGNLEPADGSRPLAREIHAVDQAKRLVAYTARLLLQREPAEIGRQQQHLELFADMIIDLYAMESAVARTAKMIRRHGEEKVKIERDLIAVFLADATDRLTARARRLFGNDTDGRDLEKHLANVARLTPFLPLRVLDARTRIAEQVVNAGGVLA